jgi:hypothetical protein
MARNMAEAPNASSGPCLAPPSIVPRAQALPVLLTLVLGAGCYRNPMTIGAYAPYVPDSLVRDASGEALPNGRRAGCLELWAAVTDSEETAPGDVLVDVLFGNRCDHSVPIDFTQLRVRDPANGLAFEPWDPRAELHPARVQALTRGRERVEFHGVRPPFYVRGAGRSLVACVEWAGMVAGADVPEGERAPICNAVWP